MNFKITIDQKTVNAYKNMSILQACEEANIIIPRFCYHERLSVAGNCRMCLVEIENAPKLVASCAVPAIANMVVHTNSLAVRKAREGVLEFLLLNHPLDCAICDQAGECDLQDQSLYFGSDRGRFKEYKRAVEDIVVGPLIKTIMSRCIHCTRCIRFANEIMGLPCLGTSGRGNSLAINLYINKLFKSEFSGNLIDLCPVGALTSKPYTFIARPWELKSVQSIDTFDGIGSNIRIDVRGYEIMRILPRLNESINEEWVSDKTRFAFDGLKIQRLYEPLLKKDNTFLVITWQEALKEVISQINLISTPYKFGVDIGAQADLESMLLLKYLVEKKQGIFLNTDKQLLDFQASYLFNSKINQLDDADCCLLLGVNPRLEGAIINLRLRKRYLAGNFSIACFGSAVDITCPIYNFGSTFITLLKFLEGRHTFSKHFSKAKKPLIIIGKSFFNILNEKQVKVITEILIKNTKLINNNWSGVNFLNKQASDSGKYELGIKKSRKSFFKMQLVYCIGESNYKTLSKDTFIIYQGHQGNSTASSSNLILPSSSFAEKQATYVNVEGRYQKTKAALFAPGNAKEDWQIIFAFIEKLFKLEKKAILELKQQFCITNITSKNLTFVKQTYIICSKLIVRNTFLPATKIENFYRSDNISKLSMTMANCTKTLLEKTPFLK